MISEAILKAGLEISQPCGGQGRCGRCAVITEGDGARRRSTIRLSPEDLEVGYALACQTVIEGDLIVTIPEQEQIERRLVTDKTARVVETPFEYDPTSLQSVQVFQINLQPPSLQDNIDDQSRLLKSLADMGYTPLDIPLTALRQMGTAVREAEWSPWVVLETQSPGTGPARLIEVSPNPVVPFGLALDIGTTTVTAFLVDLATGQVMNSAGEYNGQIARGEDVISRIIYAGKNDGLADLGKMVRETINVRWLILEQDKHMIKLEV